MRQTNISIIVPAFDEQNSVEILYQEITQVMKTLKKSYEIIFVDDGSRDRTFELLKKIHLRDKKIKVISLRGNFGKSIAFMIGFEHARGDIIFTMDADLQDHPKEIVKFLNKIEEGYDLVSGWKKKRFDPLNKTLPSKVGNFLTRKLTGIKIHDLNCGFKAYRREVLENINLYGEMYKFIPVFASKQNYIVGEIIIEHRPRKFGKSKFGFDRNTKGFLDLLTIIFLTGYLKRPGHFFGSFGILCFFLGFLIGIYISYLRILTGTIQNRHPLLFLGMLLMIVGIQLISTGLLAEMMVNFNQKKPLGESYIKRILA